MGKINVNIVEIQNLASKIRSTNSELENVLMQVKSQMRSLDSQWMSDGAKTIAERFIQFSNKFQYQKEVIENYAKFLDYTSSSYNSIESTIKANAENFN